MEIRKALELVDVEYDEKGKKATMTFLDKERKEIRVVNFNKQSYKDDKYVDDPEKEEKVEEWCKTYFDSGFEGIPNSIGKKFDIYVYSKYNSLWESSEITKFDKSMEGMVYQTSVKAITVDANAIHIQYEIEGKTYESKMTYANYMESMKQWFVDPQKKDKQFAKFKEKFHVPVEERDKLIGHPLMVEVKKAMGKWLYGDIKKFPEKK